MLSPAESPFLGGCEWDLVEKVLVKHFHNPDLQAAQAFFGTIAAHDLEGQPVWPMIIAPPGSMKTALVESIQSRPGIYHIDSVTPNTFISGQIQKTSVGKASLLERIGPSGIIVIPDFSTILHMKRDNLGSVLADLRRIFDGALRKEFGTSEKPREWKGRITLVVAATPDADAHHAVFQSLGERFVKIRMSRPGGEDAALCAMNQDHKKVKDELKDAVSVLLDSMIVQKDVELSVAHQKRVAALAELTVRARTHVHRDAYQKKEILAVPEPEAPTRLSQQMCQLAKGCARLVHRLHVTDSDLDIVRRVALDCLPPVRRTVIEAFLLGKSPAEVNPKIPKSTLSYAREDLRMLDVLTKEDGITDFALGLLQRAGFKSLLPVHQTSHPNE